MPEDAGLKRARLEDLKGGDAAHNAAALNAVLNGARNPYRDIAILNAAAALVVAEKAADLNEGARLAADAIDAGRADGRARQADQGFTGRGERDLTFRATSFVSSAGIRLDTRREFPR